MKSAKKRLTKCFRARPFIAVWESRRTSKEAGLDGIGICHLRDGKFGDIRSEIDFMKMYSQLGVLNLNL